MEEIEQNPELEEAAVSAVSEEEVEPESTEVEPSPEAKLTKEQAIAKARRWIPPAAFFGGFVFDSLTLGRRVDPLDLVLVSAYVCVALITIFLSSRYFSERTNAWVHTLSQFCIGGTFSALVVLYFKSAGGWLSLLFVLALVGLMVWNEFFHNRESQRELTWGVFCICLIMTLNFVIPHLIGTVHPLWFYLSTLASVGVIVGLWKLTKYPPKVMRTAAAATVFMVLLYTFGLIPPVPLVLKDALICTSLKKEGGEYRCDVEEQNFLVDLNLTDPVIHPPNGGPVHCLTAVFAPSNITVDMEHRWFTKTDDGWKKTDTLTFTMKGGRTGGYRYHTRKRNIRSGEWRVETAVRDGAVLGYVEFEIDREADPSTFERTRDGL